MDLREVTYLSVIIRICAAMVIGGLLGLERGLKNRAAGLRTYMLVCVGACIIMLTNQYLFQVTGSGDPMRLGAQVVSGIGFLGAGTIIVTRRNQIKGLTTAAGLWSSAGVGLALGVGFYEAALVGGSVIFVVMTLLQRMDDKMHRRSKVAEVYLELDSTIALGDFLRRIREMEVEVADIQKEYDSDSEEGFKAYVATLKVKSRSERLTLLRHIQTIPGVSYLEEL